MVRTRSNATPAPRARSAWDDDDDAPAPAPAETGRAKNTYPFRAEVDLAELDDRGRPGPTWAGRAAELSRSQITVRSRRMCYEGRSVLVAVHLVDDRPVALYGTVRKSDYDGEGLYRTTLDLAPLPDTDAVQAWLTGIMQKT